MWANYACREPAADTPARPRPRGRAVAYIARMLFSGSSGISRTLVLERMASWLVVDTVLPVMRWTW